MTIDEARNLRMGDRLLWSYGVQSQTGTVLSITSVSMTVAWDHGDRSRYDLAKGLPIQFAPLVKVPV